MQDLMNLDYRKAVLDEILGQENVQRKIESYRRSEIFNKRAKPYIDQRLKSEFPKSWQKMRKVYSINPTQRIVKKKASVYRDAPERTPQNRDGGALTEEQSKFITETYREGKTNDALQRANEYLEFQHQCFIQVIPHRGVIAPRVYQPHQIDVIPKEDDPEQAFAYLYSAFDRSKALSGGDGVDQKIADRNDGENKDEREKMRFVWWSNQHNFITDGNGRITSGDAVTNPVGDHGFIDIARRKENEFFVRMGSSVCDFAIDLAIVLSDTANINKLQGFAQMVIIAKNDPVDLEVGPENAIRLDVAESGEGQSDVKFISPNPNLEASISLIAHLVSLFLTSEGEDPKTINSAGNAVQYSSGLERFLAQLERFEASKESFEQFTWVESEIYRLICLWANHFTGASNSPLTKVPAVALPMDSKIQVKFAEPRLLQSQSDEEKTEFERVDKGISSLIMAVMKLYGFERDAAIEHLKQVAEDKKILAEEASAEPGEEDAEEEGEDEGADASAGAA